MGNTLDIAMRGRKTVAVVLPNLKHPLFEISDISFGIK
jgi:hypothetical protein